MDGKASRKWLIAGLLSCLIVLTLVVALPVGANPPAPGTAKPVTVPLGPNGKPVSQAPKQIDQMNPKDYWRIQERQRLLDAGQTIEAAALEMTGTERVLVLLVEFAGTDTFTWTQDVSYWDPLGNPSGAETVLDEDGYPVLGDCSQIITETRAFTYSGPLHNQIPRPVSEVDASGDTIWTPDFSPQWFYNFMFGNGITFNYTRTDGSQVNEDFTGKSVKQYYQDMSGGKYNINGDVIGWLQVPHSTWWYGTDLCPGALSAGDSRISDGYIPGAGSPRSLVRDALNAVNAISNTIPGFDWRNYDLNGDGVIDRLWIVHAGYGEEDSQLVGRTDYGESAIWSHSSSVTPYYPVAPSVAAGPYIIMPENGGIGVFAHESGHNLGAGDLYAYSLGEPSAGFWTIMSDDWTGFPIGFEPPAIDPLHLDEWGWLDPKVITNTTQVYNVTVGQASNFPGGEDVYRGVRIDLPDYQAVMPVAPIGQNQWWGGKANLARASMYSRIPIVIPPGGATLVFSTAFGIEEEWDFLWVGLSDDFGQTLKVLTNTHTTCDHAADWIGGLLGFPDDLCAAGMGGFTGYSADFPNYQTEEFDLSAYAGKMVLFGFMYMTDWGTTLEGPFIDNVMVKDAAGNVLFADDAESGDAKWIYQGGMSRVGQTAAYKQNYYLQWRNVSATGGYDSALGDPRWRFGPANTGLLVWYHNSWYGDNEVFSYMQDGPAFGPKGRMLVVDAHSEPYRNPAMVALGFNNEGGNLSSRGLMRDAPFSLWPSVGFTYTTSFGDAYYEGRPAVSQFDDSFGYYPGAEYVSRGPAYPPSTAMKWISKQWDAGAVLPSKAFYGIKAPGYTATEQFRYAVVPYISGPNAGRLGAYGYLANGLGYDGGSGNPREVSGQYGWHVQILSQTDTVATVKIWNAPFMTQLPLVLKRR
jgi:immune inhibitor A